MNAKRLRDAWSILGVSRGASLGELKVRHRELAVKHHPDTGGDAEAMAKVNQAFQDAKAAVEMGEAGPDAAVHTTQAGYEQTRRHPAQSPHQKRDSSGPQRRDPLARARSASTERNRQQHTTSARTTVRVQTRPADTTTTPSTGKLRSLKSLLSQMPRKSDKLGPKLQGKDKAHWGRSYGRGSNPIDE